MIVLHSTHWERGQFIAKFTAMITPHFHLQPQYKYVHHTTAVHHFTAQEDI